MNYEPRFVLSELSVSKSSELFSTSTPKSAVYAEERRPMSDAANLDEYGREPGTGLDPDEKKEACGDRGTGSRVA